MTDSNPQGGTTVTDAGHARALDLVRACRVKAGFLASPTNVANYRRVWARDSITIGLAALMSGESDLIESMQSTLITLMEHQGPHGEIPSNVDPKKGDVSYGSTAGRVDADLWFVIGCGEYWQATGDDAFLKRMLPAIERVRFLLGCWEFNDRGLIYVPQSGDWADEYIHNGYVLYDQLLYLQVHRTLSAMHRAGIGEPDRALEAKTERLKHLIQANYWFTKDGEIPKDVYHRALYEHGQRAAQSSKEQFWLPFFAPYGFGYRFDAFANVLTSLLDVSDAPKRKTVDDYMQDEVTPRELRLLPAFYPVITPQDGDWSDLQMDFSNSFKNAPYEYHNGGLWPMITGFYVADLARRGLQDAAREYLTGIHTANALPMQGAAWSFPEYVHGKRFVGQGTPHLGWSAAGALIGHYALAGEPVFRITAESLQE
ncbi:MAG TPA: glycoside hydrolase 100 family protein [Phycisphaerae bacterium]|nr:glycoside hydrolase 100 family protein [Phycisphaerae bacterium]